MGEGVRNCTWEWGSDSYWDRNWPPPRCERSKKQPKGQLRHQSEKRIFPRNPPIKIIVHQPSLLGAANVSWEHNWVCANTKEGNTVV